MRLESSDLLGTAEVASLGGVTSAAVANWRARGLIRPVAELAATPIYARSAIVAFLDTSGRGDFSKQAARDAYACLEQVRAQVKADLIAQARSMSALTMSTDSLGRPPRKFTGDGRGNGRGEWDWYFRLPSAEREHLSRKYLRGSLEPDVWAATLADLVGSPDVETVAAAWLDAVRIVDAVEQVLRGRAPRFGDVVSSDGYDVRELFGPDGARYLAGMFSAEMDRAPLDRFEISPIDLTDELEEVF